MRRWAPVGLVRLIILGCLWPPVAARVSTIWLIPRVVWTLEGADVRRCGGGGFNPSKLRRHPAPVGPKPPPAPRDRTKANSEKRVSSSCRWGPELHKGQPPVKPRRRDPE